MATRLIDPPRTSIAATFSIPFSRYISPDGQVVRALPNFADTPETLIALYRGMVLTGATLLGSELPSYSTARRLCRAQSPDAWRR